MKFIICVEVIKSQLLYTAEIQLINQSYICLCAKHKCFHFSQHGSRTFELKKKKKVQSVRKTQLTKMSKDFDLEKLRGSDNYYTWTFALENVLEYKGYSGCIIADPVTETSVSKLTSCKALISLNVESHIYVHIRNCKSALEVWTPLKKLYEDKGLSGKIGLLRALQIRGQRKHAALYRSNHEYFK